jgi:hypothetical protein
VSIFITGAINFYWDIMYGRVKSKVQREVSQNARIVSRRIVNEVRNASAINSVSASSLSLAMPDAARNPTVIDFSNNQVRIGYGSGGSCPVTNPCVLTSDQVVSNLSFTDTSGAVSESIEFSLDISSSSEVSEYNQSMSVNSSATVR